MRKLSREDWIAFARRTLVQDGIDDVKIDRLARKAKVTRGSFYWHFKTRKDLLDALLRDWELRNHVEVAEIRDVWKRDGPDLSDVFRIWIAEDPGFLDFDIAIRSWGRKSAQVGDVVRRVDAAWIGVLETVFSSEGLDGEEVLVRARIAYFHQVGYHALAFREDPEERLRLVPTYYKVLTGLEGSERLSSMLTALSSKRRNPSRRSARLQSDSASVR